MRSKLYIWGWHITLLSFVIAKQLREKIKEVEGFNPIDPAEHVTKVEVGVYFEHLFNVDDKNHLFDADFYLMYRWYDHRNYTVLFEDPDIVETETVNCDDHQDDPQGRRLENAMRRTEATRRFVEVGDDELSLIWIPDLNLRNLHNKKDFTLHSELIRIYEDGFIEFAQFVWARLELEEPDYHAFPFDTQTLSVVVESKSHTTKRLVLAPLLTFSGLEKSLLDTWPGWVYLSHKAVSYNVAPDYTHVNSCRAERRSRFRFEIDAKRSGASYIRSTFVPMFMLAVTSWVAFFITISNLMPRIAVGFISFLTLTNWASAQQKDIPSVTYTIWFQVFIETTRNFIFISLIETAICQWTLDHVSKRTARAFDHFGRVIIPGNYFVIMLILFIGGKDITWIPAVEYISWMDICCIVIMGGWYMHSKHHQLMRMLKHKPLHVHRTGDQLDNHELNALFDYVDKRGHDAVTPEEIVEALLPLEDVQHIFGQHSSSNLEKITQHQEEIARLTEHVREKFGPVQNREQFKANYKHIFAEVSLWHASLNKAHGMMQHSSREDQNFIKNIHHLFPTAQKSKEKAQKHLQLDGDFEKKHVADTTTKHLHEGRKAESFPEVAQAPAKDQPLNPDPCINESALDQAINEICIEPMTTGGNEIEMEEVSYS